eukprot:Lithocolla_globosa_v1_NODE_2425_length_2012_cov_13.446091.p1 type:complete len:616 gc:universal NODE_2425_length_2012_cov_13.446091:1976-129(-)
MGKSNKLGRGKSEPNLAPQRPPSPDLPDIHALTRNGRVDLIQKHLDENGVLDVNLLDHRGRTPLHHACFLSNASVVRFLLRRGAYVHAITSKSQLTPLHCACIAGSLDVIKLLLKYGAEYTAMAADSRTPFQLLPPKSELKKFAKAYIKTVSSKPKPPKASKKDKELFQSCVSGDELRVLELLEKGADVDVMDEKTLMTPLMAAAKQGHVEICHLLLLHCANVHQQDLLKNTPLHWCCSSGSKRILQMLLVYDCSVNLAEKENGYTPLHYAVIGNHADIVPLLIHCHSNPNLPDIDGLVPLHHAARKGLFEMVEVLTSMGCDVNVSDAFGVRPLHLSVRRGDVKTTEALLNRGADATLQSMTLSTAIHDACSGHPKLVELIMNKRPDITIDSANDEGNTPLHCLALALPKSSSPGRGQYILKALKLLLDKGSFPNARNHENLTPLMCINVQRALIADTIENLVCKALVAGRADPKVLRETPGSPQELQAREQLAEMLLGASGSSSSAASSTRVALMGDDDDDDEGVSLDDMSCGLCSELLYKPTTTECGHNFCLPCLSESIKFQPQCPVCHAAIPRERKLVVNTMLATMIRRFFPERYSSRVADYEVFARRQTDL